MFFKRTLKSKAQNCIKYLLYRLINNIPRKNVINGPNYITQSEEPVPEDIVVKKLKTNLYVLCIATGETSSVLTGETRASVIPEKRIPKKKTH